MAITKVTFPRNGKKSKMDNLPPLVVARDLDPNSPTSYREDGSLKGEGYLGALPTASGNMMSELSIGVNLGGKDVTIPSIVPTLTADEIKYLQMGNHPTPEIIQKAIEFAKNRLNTNQSVFAGNNGVDKGQFGPTWEQLFGR